jgi:hypothetical protein
MLPNFLPFVKPLQSVIEAWTKRPRLLVVVARVHAKSVHIFRRGFFESNYAHVMAARGKIGGYPGFENYLRRYTEIIVTRASETPIVVMRMTVRFADGSSRTEPLLRTLDDGAFLSVSQLPTELNFPHRIYVNEEGFPPSRIAAVEVEDALGHKHRTRHVADESELDANNEDVDGFRAWVRSTLSASKV